MEAIEGIVRNINNVPVEGVNIVIVAGPPHQDISSLTDADGNFVISSLRPGNYIIKAYGQVESDDIPVRVVANRIAYVEIWLDTNSAGEDGNVVGEVDFYDEDDYSYEDDNVLENNFAILATKWKIKSIQPAGAFRPQTTKKTYVLEFSVNGTYSLQLDTNNCFGNYKITKKGRISFQAPGCTEACCDSEFAIEATQLLTQISHYEVKNNILSLRGNGEITLTRYLDDLKNRPSKPRNYGE